MIGRLLFRSLDNTHWIMDLKRIAEPYGNQLYNQYNQYTIDKYKYTNIQIQIYKYNFKLLLITLTGTFITSGFEYSIASGRWGDKNLLSAYGVPVRIGITQPINRFMPLAALSQLRKVNTPVGRDTKLSAPRQLHGSHFGFYCPSETPEGHSCGLVKTLAILTKISIQILNAVPDLLRIIAKYFSTIPKRFVVKDKDSYKIIISGHWYHEMTLDDKQAHDLVYHLRSYRRSLQINHETGIALFTKRKEIHIQLDGGRLLRPLWIAENFFFRFDETLDEIKQLLAEPNGDILIKLLENGYIEYIGADEEESILSCENLIKYNATSHVEKLSYTHIELHGVTILGLCALDVPFSNYSQAPRVSYQCLDSKERIVMADYTTKMIRDVEVNDQVLTFNTSDLLVSKTKVIAKLVQHTSKRMIRVIAANKKAIIVTEDHLFWTKLGWKAAKDLLHLDTVMFTFAMIKEPESREYNEFSEYIRVVGIVEVEKRLIADISVEYSEHTFITASGFGVHNSSMMKQAIGVTCLNGEHRFDAVTHILHYPQKPLNSSSRWLFSSKMTDRNEQRKSDDIASMFGASGQNAIVAICSWSGYNQEDSLILNQSSIDRGLFHSTVIKTTIDNKKPGETYKEPQRKFTTQMKFAQFGKLDPDGLAPPGMQLDLDDAYVGKTAQLSEVECGYKERDVSTVLRSNDHQNHVVDAVSIAEEEQYASNVAYYDINNICNGKTSKGRTTKIKIRTRRTPEIGDKFFKYFF